MATKATTDVATGKSALAATRQQLMGRLAPYSMVILFVVELLVFSILAPTTFATQANLNVVANSSVILGLITLALLVPLLAGEIDASLPAVLTVTSLTAAALMSYLQWGFVPAVLAALVIATLIGTVNGLMVVKLNIPSLIATLGTFTIVTAAITGLASGRVIEKGLPTEILKLLSEPKPLGLPLPLYYLVAVAVLLWFVTEHTALGRYWKAIGTSEPSARMAGIKTNKMRLLAFAIGGFFAGVAGIAQLTKAQLGSPNVGPDLLFPGLTAAFLSAAAFRLGSYNVRGALLAIAVIQFGVTGLILVGAPYWSDQIFTGLALILSLVIVRVLRPSGK
jgi:ribose transport system permease protein